MTDQNEKAQGDQEREDDGSNRSHGEGTPIYLTSNSTLQSPEEHAHDKSVDPGQHTSIDVSDSDLTDANAGTLTGRQDTDENNP
ncbi:MAG: hypothetical protein JWP88_2209 [Flaviaesturariibacter sp.]|nr:hypothetical protein [Flaviaesturariibacter sp.]